MKSAVAIITYNRLNALKTTVDGLVKHCGQYPLAIFDDCSMKDDTKNYLRSLLPDAEEELDRDILARVRKDDKLKIGLGEYNLGVSAQSNRAIKWFMEETDADHLCVCNDDIHVLGDFIAFYAQAHADLNIHFWSFCDFTSEHFRSTDIRITLENEKAYDVRIIQRMTGMMISVTRELINKIGYFDSSFVFGEEHSQPAGSLVLCGDYVHRPIETIKQGDEVVGWFRPSSRPYNPPNGSVWHNDQEPKHVCDSLCKTKVIGVIKRTAPCVKITTKSGRVSLCTTDHKWYLSTEKSLDNKRYVEASVGEMMVDVTGTPEKEKQLTDDYRLGYIKGALDGDGSSGKSNYILRVTQKPFSDRFRAFLDDLGMGHYDDEKNVEQKQFNYSNYIYFTTLQSEPSKTLKDWKPKTEESFRGWLAGVYDAEGSNNSIGQSETINAKTYTNIQKALDFFNFGYRETEQRHEILINGGRQELLRFLALTQPAMPWKADKVLLTSKFCKERDRIEKIEDVGDLEVYSIQTEAGNYIADGFASKNCDFQNRARYAGAMNLNGQMFMSLDLVHQPKKLLTHQKVPSTVSSDDKAAYDEHATAMLTRSMSTLRAGNIYRPFEILNIERVGQVEGYGGINKKAMGSIPVCFDVHGE